MGGDGERPRSGLSPRLWQRQLGGLEAEWVRTTKELKRKVEIGKYMKHYVEKIRWVGHSHLSPYKASPETI